MKRVEKKKLIELLESSSLSEIEISEGEESIRITKKSDLEEKTTNKSQETIQINQNIDQQSPKNQSASTGIEIKSPMVGVFYESPNPGGKPYVSIGSNVNVGDTLCIIEAMKMMNQIESEAKGKVVSILAENGSPVEFGQVLFIVEPL